jgi:dihydroneopterin aldolase
MGGQDRSIAGCSGDRLFLKGIEILACHGVLEEERRRPQRFVVYVEAWLDMESYARADDYQGAVCYAAIHETIVEVAGGPRRSLIEALALSMVDELLRRFSRLERVAVAVHKPEAPIAGVFSDVGVVLTRARAPRE